ncbi:terpene synthase family protein [Nocardia sp. NPDC052316]|uniref:terpene synthase family protein n=1 Tax=Nocardia sp. NPDC052316 TaxID=3364329 RepID=UPI0037C91A14
MRNNADEFNQVSLPAFQLPWASTVRPDVHAIHAELFEWSARHELFRNELERDRYESHRFAWLAARYCPRADRVFAQWSADFLQWFFMLDDVTDGLAEGPQHATAVVGKLTAMLDVVDFDEMGTQPVRGETAWWDLCRRLKAWVPATENYQRWANSMRLWLLSVGLQLFDQVCADRSNPSSYVSYRRYTAGLSPFIALADVANAGPITAEEFYSPEVRRLEQLAVNVIAWSNDVLSAGVEVQQPSARSLVTVLKEAELDRSWQEAIDLAADQTYAEIAAFAQLAETVRHVASPNLAGWIDGCQDWIAATVNWSVLDSARYGLTAAASLDDREAHKSHDELR